MNLRYNHLILLYLRRPILFRAGSTNPARSFQSKHISHPHANVISSDAFARGLIRSSTDYSVYSGPRSSDPGDNSAPPRSGMQGLDYAFYKGRSRYHTRYDTVPYTTGGRKSLWSMMEVAKGSGTELLNADDTEVDEGEVRDRDAPVYFDRKYHVVFRCRKGSDCSTFSVQIDRGCVSDHQFARVQYCRPHSWSDHTRRACYLETLYQCKAA
jgi:hypothetical protein